MSFRPASSLVGAACSCWRVHACEHAKFALHAALAPGSPSCALKLKRPSVAGSAPLTDGGVDGHVVVVVEVVVDVVVVEDVVVEDVVVEVVVIEVVVIKVVVVEVAVVEVVVVEVVVVIDVVVVEVAVVEVAVVEVAVVELVVVELIVVELIVVVLIVVALTTVGQPSDVGPTILNSLLGVPLAGALITFPPAALPNATQ